MAVQALQSSRYDRHPMIGARTRYWELITRIALALYFAWAGLSLGSQQVRWATDQNLTNLTSADLLDFTAETAYALFQFTIAVLIIIRYRRLAAAGGFYPRLIALLGSFLFVFVAPFLSRNDSSPALEILSILLMLGGSILSVLVLLHLGRCFSILPEARRLVVTGPYRFVRHPLYATEMICMLGLVFQFTLWPAMLAFLVQLLIQLERMRIEERLLSRTFPEYESYAGKTPRLIPGLC